MDIKKVCDSFEKRFSGKCEKIFFAGMPLIILKGETMNISAALSVGGFAAVSRRRDGRFTAEFDDNKKIISANMAETEYHKEEDMLGFLTRAQHKALGGADILFKYNTEIYSEYEPLLLSAMYFFYGGMPPFAEARNYLSEPQRDFVSFAGVKDTLFLDGKKIRIKFCDSIAKIVICHLDGDSEIRRCSDSTVFDAANALAFGDYRRFGDIITKEYLRQITEGRVKKDTKNLFELAVRLKDMLGCGIAECGGIFAIVENRKVNTFIRNLTREYKAYYGASPDFYVTRTENSGVYGIKSFLQ